MPDCVSPVGLFHLLAQQDTGFAALHDGLSADGGLGDNVVVVILQPRRESPWWWGCTSPQKP